jgi:YegS/Rv2252/BmrU family lipid kinase
MKDVLIVANPSSGKKQAEKYAELAYKEFQSNNRNAKVYLTEKEEDIARFAKLGCREKYHTLVIMGGDGTVSKLVDAMKEEEHRPKIAIIPTGTVNNIAKGLGIATDLDQAVADLVHTKEKTVDAGEINEQLFLTSVSAGTIPETIWEVDEEQKEKFGPLAYFIEGIKSLNNEESYSLEAEIDGKKQDFDLTLLLIGVSDTILGISGFFPNAAYDDGKLHLFGLRKTSFGEKVTAFSRLLTSKEGLANSEAAFTIDFEKATFSLKEGETNVALDGDKGPVFPLTIQVRPKFVTFLIPK